MSGQIRISIAQIHIDRLGVPLFRAGDHGVFNGLLGFLHRLPGRPEQGKDGGAGHQHQKYEDQQTNDDFRADIRKEIFQRIPQDDPHEAASDEMLAVDVPFPKRKRSRCPAQPECSW